MTSSVSSVSSVKSIIAGEDGGDGGGDSNDNGENNALDGNVNRRTTGREGCAYVVAFAFDGTKFFFNVGFGGVGVVDGARAAACSACGGDPGTIVRPSIFG